MGGSQLQRYDDGERLSDERSRPRKKKKITHHRKKSWNQFYKKKRAREDKVKKLEKKMPSIRKKANKAKLRSEAGESAAKKSILGARPSALSHAQNPFLHGSKISKKEKRQEKKSSFVSRLASENSGLSKSAKRRQNRKEKSKLSSNLGDLLDSLVEQAEDQNPSDKVGYVPPKVQVVNPKSSAKSQEKVVQHEIGRFRAVLGDAKYRENPFGSLRGLIAKNLESS